MQDSDNQKEQDTSLYFVIHGGSCSLTTDNTPYEKIGNQEPVSIADEVPFDIPDSWEWCRLFSVNDMYTGNSINETEKKLKYTGLSSGYYYIGTKDVSFTQTIDYDNGVRIPTDNDKFRIAPKDSILLCVEGGSAGRKIAFTNQDVCFGNKLCCFVSYGIDYKFLFFYLQSPMFQSAFKENTTGIIGGVSVNVLRNMFLPVPPLSEQKRIVTEVVKYLPLIEEYDLKHTELDELNNSFPEHLKKSILQLAIQGKLVEQDPNDEPASVLLEKIHTEKERLIKEGRIKRDNNESVIFRRDNSHYEKLNGIEHCIDDEIPFEIPNSWAWSRLGNILNKLSDGTHSTPKYVEDGIPFISVKDVSSGVLSFLSCKYISEAEHKELYERCNPEFGDLLLTKVGTTGIPVIVDTQEEFSLFVSVALLKFDQTLIYNQYLLHLINSPLVQKQAEENTRGVGNKNWVMRDIAKTLIAIPPVEEQYRIVRAIEELFPYCDKL